MTTVTNTETLEEIAERLVRTYCAVIDGITLTASERALANEILYVLRNERERCAKVAEESGTVFYAERQKKHSPYSPKTLIFAQDVCDKIAKAIREGR